MSAIRLYKWNTILLMALLLIFFSCKEEKASKDIAILSEKIESINITTEGGNLGYFRNIG
jgi:plastocyanin domain-containing protein